MITIKVESHTVGGDVGAFLADVFVDNFLKGGEK